jgi:hypothetical protein
MERERRCINQLMEGFARIKDEYIDSGFAGIAKYEWENAVEGSDFYALQKNISQRVHCGASFVSTVEAIQDTLKEDNPSQKLIERFELMLRSW